VISKTIELKKPNLDEVPSDAIPDLPDEEIPRRPPYVLLLVAICVLIVGWVVVQGLGATPPETPVAAQPAPPPRPPVESEPTTLVREVPKSLVIATAPNTTAPQQEQQQQQAQSKQPLEQLGQQRQAGQEQQLAQEQRSERELRSEQEQQPARRQRPGQQQKLARQQQVGRQPEQQQQGQQQQLGRQQEQRQQGQQQQLGQLQGQRQQGESVSLAPGTAAVAPVELSGIHQEIPEVPSRARRTIRGHVKVTVRLIVDKDGSVFAALVDNPGPSRYFERIAIDAAKKWTFPAADGTDSRLELVQFDFTSQGTTGAAVAVQ
jgi:protein TonB